MNDWKNGVSEIVVLVGVEAEGCPQIPREKKPVEVEKRYCYELTDDDVGKDIEPPRPQYAKLKICDEVRVIEPTHEFFSAHGQIEDVLGEDQYLFRSDCGLEIGVLHASEFRKDESQYGDDWRAATKDDIGNLAYFGNSIERASAPQILVAVLPSNLEKRHISLSYDMQRVEHWAFAKVRKEKYRYCLWQMQHLEEGAEIEVLVKKRWIKAKLVTILGEKYARRFVFTTDGSNTQIASQARIRV